MKHNLNVKFGPPGWSFILVSLINAGFFLCCVIGLSIVPAGIDKIPSPKLGIQGVIICWSLFSGILVVIGSALKSQSALLCSMAFIGHVITILICGTYMLFETLYTCRHCSGISEHGDCPSWYSRCDAAYGAFLFGAVGTIVCQYILLYLANNKRESLLSSSSQ